MNSGYLIIQTISNQTDMERQTHSKREIHP